MTDFEMNANESSLTLEAAYSDPYTTIERGFRAITFEMCQDTGARSVKDIAECPTIDALRELVKTSMQPTHYQTTRSDGSSASVESEDAWGDALRILKTKLHQKAIKAGADVSKGASPVNMVNAIVAAEAATAERERLNAERKEEEARCAADREMRRTERADFDAWTKLVHGTLRHTDADYLLAVTMREAYDEVDTFSTTTLPEHIQKLQKDPFYTLRWSGYFVEASAKHIVAQWAVELFEDGVSAQVMADEALRMVLSKSDRSASRSTSVMSNLTEDCLHAAWVKCAKKLTGHSFW